MKRTKIILAFVTILMIAGILLAGCGMAAGSYEVLVTDENENPVPGVTIQFCSDTECIMGETDDKGIASFDQEAGTYTIHVLRVPDGFAADDTEYTAPSEPGRVTIELH